MTTVPFTFEAVSRGGGGICSEADKRAFDSARRATGFRAGIPKPAAVGAIDRTLVRRAIKTTAEHLGAAVPYFIPDCRKQPLCPHQQAATYVAREMNGRSLGLIDNKISDRHHATIWHGVRAIRRQLDADGAEMAAAVESIMERVRVTAGIPWAAVHPSNREALV